MMKTFYSMMKRFFIMMKTFYNMMKTFYSMMKTFYSMMIPPGLSIKILRYLTLTIQPHKKIWTEIFFINTFAIVSFFQKKFKFFFKIVDFFYPFRQIYFQVQTFFRLKIFFLNAKIKENFISFLNMFLKRKKRLNRSNNIVKTKIYNFYCH